MTERINWERQIAFVDTQVRGHFCHFQMPGMGFADPHGTEAVVSDINGTAYIFDRTTGSPVGHNRHIANFMSDAEQAAARVAIKRAQRQRAAEAERAQLQDHPLFGQF